MKSDKIRQNQTKSDENQTKIRQKSDENQTKIKVQIEKVNKSPNRKGK